MLRAHPIMKEKSGEVGEFYKQLGAIIDNGYMLLNRNMCAIITCIIMCLVSMTCVHHEGEERRSEGAVVENGYAIYDY